MKVLIDIKDSKVAFVLELLNSLSFVKVKPLAEEKMEIIENLSESVNELNKIKQGKLKGISAKNLLDEL